VANFLASLKRLNRTFFYFPPRFLSQKNRPYARNAQIITALSLRFNYALTYRGIVKQLNISTATHLKCSTFSSHGYLLAGATCVRLSTSNRSFTFSISKQTCLSKNAALTGLLSSENCLADLTLQPRK
jgi:hypothetical protein